MKVFFGNIQYNTNVLKLFCITHWRFFGRACADFVRIITIVHGYGNWWCEKRIILINNLILRLVHCTRGSMRTKSYRADLWCVDEMWWRTIFRKLCKANDIMTYVCINKRRKWECGKEEQRKRWLMFFAIFPRHQKALKTSKGGRWGEVRITTSLPFIQCDFQAIFTTVDIRDRSRR